jgi:hypothetical protein
MSLAHLRAPKLPAPRKRSGAADAEKVVSGPASYCGASREPIYRTLDEASESGLEICGTCLLDSRQRKAGH